mmetsp:Transcript_3472/g.4613  ORF Transcript_3472/g.4613 Transcript_3472/m.4613 type:complete len:420 (-) Transcript_3472:21-1280(-)
MAQVESNSTNEDTSKAVDGAVAVDVVILDWKDVVGTETSDSLLNALEQALGPGGVGLVAIRNVPEFVEAKRAFLPMAHALISLEKKNNDTNNNNNNSNMNMNDYLESNLTDAASLYNAGWSHGKEKLGDDKPPDTSKGSFYYNPLTDTPGTPEDRQQYPLSYPCNLWPDKDILPGFKQNACHIGVILKEAVVELSKHIDALALRKAGSNNISYPPQFLYKAMKDTEKAKARLLYYYPLAEAGADQSSNEEKQEAPVPAEDSWIGWHNDSGFLTALAGDMYVDHKTGKAIACPDPAAGLYVVDRNDVSQHILLPEDCMAVQIGECTQIVTGGAVVATPHCVRGCSSGYNNIARISLPCFVDTPPAFPLNVPQGSSRKDIISAGLQSGRVPPLDMRWKEGMTFGDFLSETFSLYYNWSSSK